MSEHGYAARPPRPAGSLELPSAPPRPREPARDWLNGRLISIEGPTGVGKTTLARHLAPAMGAELLLDPFEDNTYLLRLLGGQDNEATRLGCELSFVALRTAALRRAAAILAEGVDVVADWAWFKGFVFAATTLDTSDADRVAATCRIWETGLPSPDLLITINAPISLLRARIRRRARPGETHIHDTELEYLTGALARAAADSGSPLLQLDASQFNTFDTAHLHQLINRINEYTRPDRSQPHAPSHPTTPDHSR